MISVIVPTYNRPHLLKFALDSIQAQTYPDFEAIVINDGGVGVSDIVDQYEFARYYSHAVNGGLSAARNTGIRYAKGEHLAFLDDDDQLFPNALEILHTYLNIGQAKMVYSDGLCHQPDNWFVYRSHDYSWQQLKSGNITPVCCVLVERALVQKVGAFDETLRDHEDWDLWLRVCQETTPLHVPFTTCVFRHGFSDSMTGHRSNLPGREIVKKRYEHI